MTSKSVMAFPKADRTYVFITDVATSTGRAHLVDLEQYWTKQMNLVTITNFIGLQTIEGSWNKLFTISP